MGHLRRMKSGMKKGFSMVELMIVVAILSILAAIAVPNFQTMVLKARKAEATPNLRGIGDASVAYYAANSAWVTGASNPGNPIGKNLQAWKPTMAGWVDLGYRPDGMVRCTYVVKPFGSDSYARADAFCDVDDNNDSAIVRYYTSRVTTGAGGYFSYVNRDNY